MAGGIVAVDDVAPAAGLADLAAKRVIADLGAPATLVDAGHQPAIAAIHVLLALASGIGLADQVAEHVVAAVAGQLALGAIDLAPYKTSQML